MGKKKATSKDDLVQSKDDLVQSAPKHIGPSHPPVTPPGEKNQGDEKPVKASQKRRKVDGVE